MAILEKLAELEHEADDFGFSWENPHQIMDQIKSEFEEISDLLNEDNQEKQKLQEEIGDLLHAVFSLCVFSRFDPQETLEKTVAKFERRLKAVKQLALEKGLSTLKGKTFQELMVFWNEIKVRENTLLWTDKKS